MAARRSTVTVLAAALAALVLLAAGCGGDDEKSASGGGSSSSGGGSAPATKADPKLAGQVPEKFKSKGTLVVAADASYPPNEFIGKDGKTVEGMDADLAKAIAGVLGLKADVKNATFDAIIPGLAAGKYDLGMSSFTDTKEREQTVDFVTYLSVGTAFYVKAQGGVPVSGLADLCGKTVAVEKGTTQATDATKQSGECTGAGKPAVKVLTFPDQNGANLALSSGRAQVGMADYPVAVYGAEQSNGQFKVVGKLYGTAPYGIAVPKDSGLAKSILAGLKKLIADGTYAKILKQWDLSDAAIDDPVINGAVS